MTDTLKIRVPFAGYYCSAHDMQMDDQLAQINQDDSGNEVEILSSTNVDWSAVRLAYSQAYIGKLSEFVGIDMTYEELSSPRFYNFETDALFVTMANSDFEDLYKKIALDADLAEGFRAHVEKALERRSGFIPFYSNDLEDWGPLNCWDDTQKSVLLDFYTDHLELDEADIAAELGEGAYNAIWNAVIDMSKVRELEAEGDLSP